MDSSTPSLAVAEQEALPGLFHGSSSERGVLSPKRPAVETAGMADVFPYYAGFAFEWATKQLSRDGSHVGSDMTVLDPWNGSGTTTLAAQSLGIRSIGVDRNPVANVIARLRGETSLKPQLTEAPPSGFGRGFYKTTDPLNAWFSDRTTRRLRDWTTALRKADGSLNAVAAVALFRVIRRVTKKFEGSNPTWVKRSKSPEDRIRIPARELDEMLLTEQRALCSRIATQDLPKVGATILTASSDSLPLRNNSVDVILTSPPYLTRIDYAVAYARELAILGHDISADRTLRSSLMGTTLIRKSETFSHEFGPVAQELLVNISGHDSKASSGYYLKQAQQYLTDLSSGLDEISRVCKEKSLVHLVVQDSFYKDVPVPLAEICIDEATARGWVLEEREQFVVRRSLVTLNTPARAYKKSNVAESVITLRRG
ncbi:hypothetical protein ACFWAN_19640 [Streptomyces mirabilis]|uniref:hypothetical protein n=1 Tax=Streptomyces mirabilis TaxID=68239 RepID=UPI0036570E9A